MPKNNYARLKAEADIACIVQYLGLEVNKKGSAFFIHCPLPDHNDRHATNCYFREGWNNVYCTVCCKAINAIDLIMLETGMDYGEAADLLWDLEGSPDWYYADWKKKSPTGFSLSREDAEMIGINLPGRILSAVNVADEKPGKGYGFAPSYTDGYLICKTEHLTWKDFLTEQQYRIICANKAREKRISCILAAKHCTGALQSAFVETAIRCAEIEEKCLATKKAVA